MDGLVGNKIKEIRERKGMAQAMLAEKSGVSIRTIQRIELGQTNPQGRTLQLICESLGVPIEELMDYNKRDDRQFLMWFHLSVLSGIFLPLGNILLPLILWLTKKNDVLQLKRIGAKLLNFQIVFQVLIGVWGVAVILFKIEKFNFLDDWGGLASYFLISCLNYIAAITFAIFNYRGKQITYPSIIPMIR